MMKTILFIILGAMICFRSNCQMVNSKGFIDIRILDDSLRFSAKNWKKDIAFRVRNDSHGNLLVYGLNNAGFRGIPPHLTSQLCELENVGLGLGLVIYNSAGVQLSLNEGIIDRFSDKPVTRSRLDSSLRIYRNRTASDTSIFKEADERVFMKPIDIGPFDLEKGTYLLQIVMYCGRQITFSVSEERITADSKRSKADLYQGCSFSNMIKVIVD